MKQIALLLACLAGALPAEDVSIAVPKFGYPAVMADVKSVFGTAVDIGEGIRSLSVEWLQQGRMFTVVASPEITGLDGAGYTLFAEIVAFRQERLREPRWFVLYIVPPRPKYSADVVIQFRLVHNQSSRVVVAGQVQGTSKGLAPVRLGGNVDMSSQAFASTVLGKAVLDAVRQMVVRVEAQYPFGREP